MTRQKDAGSRPIPSPPRKQGPIHLRQRVDAACEYAGAVREGTAPLAQRAYPWMLTAPRPHDPIHGGQSSQVSLTPQDGVREQLPVDPYRIGMVSYGPVSPPVPYGKMRAPCANSPHRGSIHGIRAIRGATYYP